MDKSSKERGVRQFKTALLQRLEQEDRDNILQAKATRKGVLTSPFKLE